MLALYTTRYSVVRVFACVHALYTTQYSVVRVFACVHAQCWFVAFSDPCNVAGVLQRQWDGSPVDARGVA